MKDTDIIAAIAPDAVSLMDKAIAEIKRLRQENETLRTDCDEARRLFCKCHAQAEAAGYAEGRGWDCFKEDGK